MTHWLDEPPRTNDVVTIPVIWMAIVLSLLIHAAWVFLWVPRARLFGPDDQKQEQASDRLQVELATQDKASPPPPDAQQQLQAVPPPRPRTVRPRPSIAVVRPRIDVPAAAAPEIAAPPPAPPEPNPPTPPQPIEGDFLSFLQGRRPATGVPESTAAERDKAEFDQKIAANLPPAAHGTAIRNAHQGGGIFEIKRETYDDAAFEFLGWNDEMHRETPQLIEVRLGNNANMHIAIVRKMITIIRQRKTGDFVWQSGRQGQEYVLSARPEDNAKLEAFLMRDMFQDVVPQR